MGAGSHTPHKVHIPGREPGMAGHGKKGGTTLTENLATGAGEPGYESRGEEDLSCFLRAHPVKIRRFARACGCRCEHCGFSYPINLLSVHILDPQNSPLSSESDPQSLLLVLCPICLSLFATPGVSREQKTVLVRLRPDDTSQAMRKILMTRSRPYSPPESRDWAEIFGEIMTGCAPDLCLNGG